MPKTAKIEGVITIKNGSLNAIIAKSEKCGHLVVYSVKEMGFDDVLSLLNKEDNPELLTNLKK